MSREGLLPAYGRIRAPHKVPEYKAEGAMRAQRNSAYHKCATGGEWLPRADQSADIVNNSADCASRESASHKGQQKRGVGA